MRLADIIAPEAICTDLVSKGKTEVLAEIGSIAAKRYSDIDKETIAKILIDREQLVTTGIGEGVAIPHAKIEGLKEIRIAVGISKKGIPFDAVDRRPVHIFFAILAPLGAGDSHLKALARISRLLNNADIRARLREAKTAKDVFDLISERDGKH